MENIILRAMRTFDESVCAPEYARNQLAIEIIFPEPPVFINESGCTCLLGRLPVDWGGCLFSVFPKNSSKGTFYCAVGYILGRKPVSYFRISERTSQMDCFSVSLAFLRGLEKREVG